MRLALNRHVLVDGPVVDGHGAQRMQMLPTPAVTTGLDERVVMLVVGLAVAACAGLLVGGGGLVATLSNQPLHVATLLAAKYPQYRTEPPDGPVLAVDVTEIRDWSA